MYLIDSNIVLELLLDQSKADEVERFLKYINADNLFFSEFSLYSVGILLFKRKLLDVYYKFTNDLLKNGGVHLVRISLDDIPHIIATSNKFKIDFDDSYQYVIAEKNNLTIVSFDTDFDKTERGRKTPTEILAEFSKNVPS